MKAIPINIFFQYSRIQGLNCRAFYFVTMFCILLIGCANNPRLSAEQISKPRQFQDSLQLSGRISIQYQQNELGQNLSGSYEWQQTKDALNILLSSPLGQTIAKIKQDKLGASLEQAKQETRTASNIEQLLTESLGWSLPVEGLKAWLQGFDVNSRGEIASIPAQNLTNLSSQGWQLQFVSWQEDGGRVHPKRIDLSRNTNQVGELKIRIMIDEWN